LTKYLNEESIAQFSTSAYSKPNIAVVANGATQADLAKWVGEFFKETSSSAAALKSEATKYYGGEERIAHDSGNSLVIAFPGSSSFTSGSSYKPEIAVLAALLGGKSSIKWSSGFSLLSKAVSAISGASTSTTHFAYSDAGLLTIQFSGSAQAIRDASAEAVKALKSVSEGTISKEDFTKAVALAKYRALEEGQNIESGLVATGSGLIHGGKPFQIDEVGKSVESVTTEKLKSVFSSQHQHMLHLETNPFNRQPRDFWRVKRLSQLLEIFTFCHMLKSLVLRFRWLGALQTWN
jgi:ubiquinol-cytochrome c reductase core subunit 2